SAHSGEYDGELVENEGKRIREIFEAPAPAAPPEEKKSFLGRLFNSNDED
ncbi:hypothetical protein HY224_02400, partial [Candidatus Uhrbacteria bacterium]|nr:hypothetical protein [Candidatus Uhrbacteria bacterium]